MLPFFAVSGATGIGKSTVCARLPAVLPEVVPLDGDLLWRTEWWDSPASVEWFYATWLRLAAQVNRSGRPMVLCTAVHPPRFEHLPERAEVSVIHYLALVAEPEVHERRLRSRWPDDDVEADPHFGEYLAFNRWLRDNGPSTDPPMSVLDTTDSTPEETTAEVAAWIRARLPSG